MTRVGFVVVGVFTLVAFPETTSAESVRTLERSISFDRDVMAVLSKAGCNQGGCHGNANGKGGFRLSLRGENADFDYQWLTKRAGGRRVNAFHPSESLLLLKPTGQVPHEGGVRFRKDSLEYRVLKAWVEQGTPRYRDADPSLIDLELGRIEPFVYAPMDQVKLTVWARFSDGTRQDVTRLTTFETSNLNVEVDEQGHVTRQQYGEATVLCRYLHLQVPVSLAFVPQRPEFRWERSPEGNYIDRLVNERLRRLRILPSELADDAVFVRRAFLDAIGVLPTAAEAQDFVRDRQPDKRPRLIDQLLTRPEFADHWALKWSDVLRVEEKVLDPKGVSAYHAWIREQMAEGLSLDQFVRKLIRAEGSTYDEPASNFWRANRDPTTRGETTARLFLGARLQCAKCHNHPFDRWTQEDYYNWAAVFARVDYEIVDNERKDRLDKNEFVGEQVVKVGLSGHVRNPSQGDTARPKLLGGAELGPGAYHDRLTPLAVWLTAPDNDRFAQVQANFVWYHVMGRGLVEPIDDFRETNPASHPALLRALADDLVAHQFDLRHLVRRIMNSHTYQRSAAPNATNATDERNFARAIVQRLPAEKLLDAQTSVLGVPVEFAGYDLGIRAQQIPGVRRVRLRDQSPLLGDRFLRTFGKPERLLACECERSNESTLAQTFLLIGGGLHERLQQPENRLAKWAASPATSAAIVDALYWSALNRPPSSVEQEAAVAYLEASDRFARLQDLTWALLNSKEFLLRH